MDTSETKTNETKTKTKSIYCHKIQHFSYGEMSESEKKLAESPWKDKEKNAYITETAGFVPLVVKFKRFIENGQIAQFRESDFTSSDWRELYATDPDLDISPSDEFDEVQEKLALREELRQQILARKAKSDEELSTVRRGGGAPQGVATTTKTATVDNSGTDSDRASPAEEAL